MKYVVMKDDETGEVIKLGRFSGKPKYIDEMYLPISGWQKDNSLDSDMFDGLLEEISETEANHIIATPA